MEGLSRLAQYEKVVCGLIEYRVRKHLGKEVMLSRNFDAQSYLDMISQSLVIELKAIATSRERVETEEMKLPDGWWESFKERWFPKWALKRWPVKWKRFVVTKRVYHCCPHMDVKVQGPHLVFLQQVDRKGA